MKDKALEALQAEFDQKEKKLLNDLVSAGQAHEQELEKLNVTLKDVKAKLAKKEEAISKAEKDRREALLAKDKANKLVDTARADRDQAKQNLATLETEKRHNNFGKYEKEKMKAELDALQEEKQKMTSKIESLTSECTSLKSKIEEMSKGGEKTKQDLHKKNTGLLSKVANLENQIKDLENAVSNEKLKSSETSKDQLNKLKTLTEEKNGLEADLRKHKSQETQSQQELEKVKSRLKTVESEKATLSKQISQIQKEHLSAAASKGDDAKAQTAKIQSLQKTNSELDIKFNKVQKEKSELESRLAPLEKDKSTLTAKLSTLEGEKKALNKRIEELTAKAKGGNQDQLKKVQLEVSNLKKESQGFRKDKEDLCRSFKAVEKEIKKQVKDIQPKKVQTAMKKLVESIEKNTLVPKDDLAPVSAGMSEEDQAEMNALADELEEVVIQLESKCSEVEEWKANFESLQVDCAERTSELENLNSQLQKAKHDGNTAVEKLKKKRG